MQEKLRNYFDGLVVYKDLRRNAFFSTLGAPSFIRDTLLDSFQDEDGEFDLEEAREFVAAHLPGKEQWLGIKNRVVYEYERVKILTKIVIDIDIASSAITFSLPNYDLTNKDTIVETDVWEDVKDQLTNGVETWGTVELGYRPPDPNAKPKLPGKIKLMSFKSFQPLDVDLEFYKDASRNFTIDEWLDVLLGAIDYNPSGYRSTTQKRTMLARLLPFVEKNLNLLELAPKGTGKSYVFGRLSKFGCLIDGGKVTRAQMFYNVSRRQPGYIQGKDYVALDEIKLARFNDDIEMRSILQTYMENGQCSVNGNNVTSSAGVVMLGNISSERMSEYSSMLDELPPLFKESALLDRIHGFIPGWDIPYMTDDLKANGWAMNTEYFCSIMHAMRSDPSYDDLVNSLIDAPRDAYLRHTRAVRKLAGGFLKLFFPYARETSDVDKELFTEFCLNPAIAMRTVILRQAQYLDRDEYMSKPMPQFILRDAEGANG